MINFVHLINPDRENNANSRTGAIVYSDQDKTDLLIKIRINSAPNNKYFTTFPTSFLSLCLKCNTGHLNINFKTIMSNIP